MLLCFYSALYRIILLPLQVFTVSCFWITCLKSERSFFLHCTNRPSEPFIINNRYLNTKILFRNTSVNKDSGTRFDLDISICVLEFMWVLSTISFTCLVLQNRRLCVGQISLSVQTESLAALHEVVCHESMMPWLIKCDIHLVVC